MSKHEAFLSKSMSTEEVSTISLAAHLGVSRNSIPAITKKFGLTKDGRGYQKLDVFRKVHGIEPLLLAATFAAIKVKHSHSVPNDSSVGGGSEAFCMVEELSSIYNLAETLWDQGLVPIRDISGEYGYAHDTFRKKLKFGAINLPPVQPIEFSPNRVMYRPLDVVLWHRHRIVLNLPRAVVPSPNRDMPSPREAENPAHLTAPTSEAMASGVFAAAIAATDQKSGFSPSPAPSPDGLHNPRQ